MLFGPAADGREMSGTLKQNPAESAPRRQKTPAEHPGPEYGHLRPFVPPMPPTHTAASSPRFALIHSQSQCKSPCFFRLPVFRRGFDQPAVTSFSIYWKRVFTGLIQLLLLAGWKTAFRPSQCIKPLLSKGLATPGSGTMNFIHASSQDYLFLEPKLRSSVRITSPSFFLFFLCPVLLTPLWHLQLLPHNCPQTSPVKNR